MIYLATPYSKYALGPEAAFIEAARITGRLIASHHDVFSPIIHSHAAAVYGNLDLIDVEFWERVNKPFLNRCDICYVATMDGWQQSSGIHHEIEAFKKQRKGIFLLDPITLKSRDYIG